VFHELQSFYEAISGRSTITSGLAPASIPPPIPKSGYHHCSNRAGLGIRNILSCPCTMKYYTCQIFCAIIVSFACDSRCYRTLSGQMWITGLRQARAKLRYRRLIGHHQTRQYLLARNGWQAEIAPRRKQASRIQADSARLVDRKFITLIERCKA
jgi:hypothetical protein